MGDKRGRAIIDRQRHVRRCKYRPKAKPAGRSRGGNNIANWKRVVARAGGTLTHNDNILIPHPPHIPTLVIPRTITTGYEMGDPVQPSHAPWKLSRTLSGSVHCWWTLRSAYQQGLSQSRSPLKNTPLAETRKGCRFFGSHRPPLADPLLMGKGGGKEMGGDKDPRNPPRQNIDPDLIRRWAFVARLWGAIRSRCSLTSAPGFQRTCR